MEVHTELARVTIGVSGNPVDADEILEWVDDRLNGGHYVEGEIEYHTDILDMERIEMDDGLKWEKSPRSNGANNCIEVASQGGDVFLRDTKDATGTILRTSAADFDAFVGGIRDGWRPGSGGGI
jgi:hypothetical protein